MTRTPLVSVVSPAFNECDSLLPLRDRLDRALAGCEVDWEWIIVDDNSSDATQEVIAGLAASDARVRGFRLASNSGSDRAIHCGLDAARGNCAIVMASDLQDPPELLPRLIELWRAGTPVVLATRKARPGEARPTLVFSRMYYWLLHHVAGLRRMPSRGADFFLIDRKVMRALETFPETTVSRWLLLVWMGFPTEVIEYTKQARAHGRSGWTLRKKCALAFDSVIAFSPLPIRIASAAGVCLAVLGFVYLAFVLVNAWGGHPVQGWSSLMAVTIVMGGFQMLMLGLVGEYLWRNLEESRRRPRYVIEWESEPRVRAADHIETIHIDEPAAIMAGSRRAGAMRIQSPEATGCSEADR